MNSTVPTVDRAERVFTPALHLYYPLTIARGDGVYVEATDGRRYLDFSSGLAVLNIGHRHPRVQAAVLAQLDRFVHTGGVYYNETSVVAAERLLSVTPAGLDMLFFSNSGAEAVEGALKLARFVTNRQGIISFTGAFHGRTLGAVSVTTSSARYRKKYHPLLPSVYQAPYPHCFRCQFNPGEGECRMSCFAYLEHLLSRVVAPDEVAAVIIEPVLGEGGYAPAPKRFLQELRNLCSRHGILLIFDEVQTGMGRTGEWFAADYYGVVPDILAVAKGIASGFPLSAVVAARPVMERWEQGAHGTTFGGNPVSCAAAIATIDAISAEHLLEHGRTLGAVAFERLRLCARDNPVVGDIRGPGLMIGIELVDAQGNPNSSACNRVLEYCLERGLILIGCGLERNVIRFLPPLTVTAAELDQGLSILGEAIGSLS
jgi:4-aminobutyrate aminotransferase